jgi:hypothetical protein
MAAHEMSQGRLPECDPFEGWSLPLLELPAFRSLDQSKQGLLGPAQAEYLLGFSILAPSTHNSVPQAYRLDLAQDRIELWLQREKVLPESDPKGREALTSIGCAVENLVRAAAQYGVTCAWEVSPDLDWGAVGPSTVVSEVYVGQLRLSDAELPDEATRRAMLRGMLERRTVRAEFDSTERLPPRLSSSLVELTTAPVRVLLFESSADKFSWGKLDELAVKHKLEDSAFRRELGDWLLPNEDKHSPRGMRGREFGLDDRVTRDLSARLRGEASMPADQLAFMARAGRVGLCSASAVCVLSCTDPGPAGAILAGRVFQRCLLLAGAHGFVCAVHAAVCHVPHARAMSQATLTNALTPSVIFRIGKPRQASDAARPHSSRPRLEELLLGPKGGPTAIRT